MDLGRKDTFKNPEITGINGNEGFEGPHASNSTSDQFNTEQKTTTELLSRSFPKINSPYKLPENRNTCQTCLCFWVFLIFYRIIALFKSNICQEDLSNRWSSLNICRPRRRSKKLAPRTFSERNESSFSENLRSAPKQAR